ncbi:MAG: glycosyltransferase family 39 protein [Chloroflexi bacterium]|nr:glycosyltransferase family 39 protein [Chloroflexota bacterium]
MKDQVIERSETGWLDRPIWPHTRLTWFGVLYAALVLFIVLTRLWSPGTRAYSHDESIHAWESWKLATGQGYIHNPVYHGPLLYHLTALVFVLLGHNDVTARLAATLMGIGITIAPFFLQRWLGKRGVLAVTLLMAVSPVLMHRSRFIRHDQGAVLANMILFIALLNYLERP